MIGDPVLSRAARTVGAARVAESTETQRRRRLVDSRHGLMLAALEDAWYAPWRARRRRRDIARIETQLNQGGHS